MFTTARILAVSLLASLVSALPAGDVRAVLPELSDSEALDVIERATLAPVYTKCSVANTVAITFDDGPYLWQSNIVATLKKYSAKATFFVNGDNWSCIYSDANVKNLKATYAAGHQIASHTWHHYNWTTLTNDQLMTEMTRTDAALLKILGVKPAYVRPPYGSYNKNSQQVAAANGQSIVVWDFDSGDADGNTVKQSEALYKAAANAHPKNLLTLNHETHNTTALTVLPYALKTLGAKGYKFVTVAECLGSNKPYLTTTKAKSRDATWTC